VVKEEEEEEEEEEEGDTQLDGSMCPVVLGKFGLCLKLISEIEGLEWSVCFEILEPPSPMTRDGGSKISKQTDHSKPSISLISFRHKPNFPNTSAQSQQSQMSQVSHD
jgi:hypothetical protein